MALSDGGMFHRFSVVNSAFDDGVFIFFDDSPTLLIILTMPMSYRLESFCFFRGYLCKKNVSRWQYGKNNHDLNLHGIKYH
jgi:hypothetical protein